MGAPCNFQVKHAHNLRRWPVKGFENWLIFYLPTDEGIDVVRVIHGARNIAALLDD